MMPECFLLSEKGNYIQANLLPIIVLTNDRKAHINYCTLLVYSTISHYYRLYYITLLHTILYHTTRYYTILLNFMLYYLYFVYDFRCEPLLRALTHYTVVWMGAPPPLQPATAV